MTSKIKKKKKTAWIIAVVLLSIMITIPFIISAYVQKCTAGYLITDQQAEELDADCILVLGAGLRPDGTPNAMLQDRLKKGIALYKEGAAPKILLSGDNGQIEYDEVNAMKQYALNAGIPSEDIFMDHAGFSTYESMYRARDIFLVKRAIIVTQRYHQYRALYIAREIGIEGYGVVPQAGTYAGQTYREIREILARDKDFLKAVVKPEPTYLGDSIPINGSGLLSHD